MKKIISLFLSVVMLLSITAGIDLSAYAATSGDFEYEVLDDGTAEITDYTGSATELTIPSTIDGYTVTSIGGYSFYECTNLTSITIPDSITSIGESAFDYCTSLTSLTIPDSVTNIGDYAFWVTSLTSITISKNVISIGNGAFAWCNGLTGIVVDENNPYYSSQDGVLFNKDKTELIQYPTGNEGASYKILESVTSIGKLAFYNCTNLTNVIIPDSVTSIAKQAFFYCENLKSVTIPDSVTSIGDWAFCECTSLTNITIQNVNCEICDSSDTISDTATIYGYKNSTAQTYAEKYYRTFVDIETGTVYDYSVNKECEHNYTSTVTKAATCSAMGVKTYTCTVCGATKTETIAKTAHTYTNVVTKATLSKNGKITPTCSVCGATKSATTIYYAKTIKLSSTSYTYDGKAHKPSLTIKDSKGNKINSKYYTVTYSNSKSKSVGKYTVTIKFKGNYSGTKTLTYTIKPKATSISKITAKSKGFTVKWKKQATQTTGYQIQYSTSKDFSNAKTVTVSKTGTTSKTISKLKSKKKYYVRVRTYKTVKVNGKSTKIYSSWSKSKTVTTKK